MITLRLWIDGIVALGWGYLADRFNRKNLLRINGALTGSLIMVNAFLPVGGGLDSYVFWLVFRGFIGGVMSGGGPNSNSLASDLLSSNEKSRYFGYSSISWQGTQVVGMILSAVMFSTGYWQLFYIVSGASFLAYTAFITVDFTEPPRAKTRDEIKNIVGNINVEYKYKMTKETIKDTVLRPTNMLAFAEGIFTSLLFGIIDLVWLPYIQSPPRNISPLGTSIFILIFGIPGAFAGSLVFGRLSDKAGGKNLKRRVLFLATSLIMALVLVFVAFTLPLPELTETEGKHIATMFAYPVFIVFGIVMFFMRANFSIFTVNQPPIIQEINLPEFQGQMASLGQLVEIFSYGTGPLIAGIVLSALNNDYQLAIQHISLIAIPGVAMWFIAIKWVEQDRARVRSILEHRAREMKIQSDLENEA